MTSTRLDRWERRAEWPLTLLAVAFLGAYAWPILDPGLSPGWVAVCTAVDTGVWALFGVDYVVRLVLSEHRWRFVRTNLLDLAILLLPVLRPLRLLRLFTLLRLLDRYAGRSLRGRVAVYVGGSTVLLLFLASLAILDAERGAPEATITTFADAAWWGLTTVTSVGYGDTYPVTGLGRVIASALMLMGVALLGAVTASVATWLVERVSEEDEAAEAARRADLRELSDQVAALRAELRDRP